MKRSHKNARRRKRMLANVKAGGRRLGLAGFHRSPRPRHEEDGRARHRIERHHVRDDLRKGDWD